MGGRRPGPFLRFECADHDQIEYELFGSLAGIGRRKPGVFETANNGTVFLNHGLAARPSRLRMSAPFAIARLLSRTRVAPIRHISIRGLPVEVTETAVRGRSRPGHQQRFLELRHERDRAPMLEAERATWNIVRAIMELRNPDGFIAELLARESR